MSRQITKIDYAKMEVEDGGILYDMEDLARLNHIYERFCTAEYLFENFDDVETMSFAYAMADYIREKVDDYCTCEQEMITEWYNEAKKYAIEDIFDEGK